MAIPAKNAAPSVNTAAAAIKLTRFRTALDTRTHLDFIVTDLDEVVGRLFGLGASLEVKYRAANTGASPI
jgi:Glyoxalase-like domain